MEFNLVLGWESMIAFMSASSNYKLFFSDFSSGKVVSLLTLSSKLSNNVGELFKIMINFSS